MNRGPPGAEAELELALGLAHPGRVRVPGHDRAPRARLGRRDPRRQRRDNPSQLRLRDVRHPREARLHLVVHGVDRAAADGIVRMVLERDAPGEIEERGVGVAAERGEPRGERLEMARQQTVVQEVGALERHARGRASLEQRRPQAGAQLAAVHREVGRSLAPRALEKTRQRPDLGAGARQLRDRRLQRGGKPRLRHDVIAPVHQQQARNPRPRGEALGLVAQPLGQRLRTRAGGGRRCRSRASGTR